MTVAINDRQGIVRGSSVNGDSLFVCGAGGKGENEKQQQDSRARRAAWPRESGYELTGKK